MDLIRVWKEIDINDIDSHIIITDDLHGFCPGCKTTGIKYSDMHKCHGCGREFKYAATREKSETPTGTKIIAKIKSSCPHLVIVDYSDYRHHADKNKAASLFGNI